MKANLFRLIAGIVALFSAACVHSTEAPTLAGPSALSTTLNVTATPDRISQDGSSQSSIQVQAIGPDGRVLSGMPVRVDLLVDGSLVDYGSLASKSIVTGSDGIARTVYTAPPPSATQSVSTVTVRATPIGSDAQTSNVFAADIRLMPTGVVLPPADTPTPQFTISPSPVNVNVPTTFDASTSCPGTAANGVCQASTSVSITSYQWNFGDGTTGSGRVVTHTYLTTGTFNGSLTITNDRGVSASAPLIVTPGSADPFTGDWIASPPIAAGANIGQAIIFNADAIQTSPGHQVTTFNWSFGDGDTTQPTTGFVVTHRFSQAGTYSIVLSVLDDLGRKKVFPAKVLVIGTGNPTAVTSFSPTTPVNNQPVFFDGTGSTASAGATIVTYVWSWGDGTADSTGPNPTHTFTAAGSFVVRLTVTDSNNPARTGTTTRTVAVQ